MMMDKIAVLMVILSTLITVMINDEKIMMAMTMTMM